MSVKDRINQDLKTAMKAKDKERTSVLRMILSEIKYTQAAVNVHQELSEPEAQKVVSAYYKRLLKALDDYPEGEKREQIRAELRIIEEYLPKRVGPEEVQKVIDDLLSTTEERGFGPLMKEVLARLEGGGDGKVVSQLLKDKLATL